MTLNELKTMDCDVITPAVASQILRCDPHWIRVAAREDKGLLGFPVVILGSRIKIPRLAFIRYMEGSTADEGI